MKNNIMEILTKSGRPDVAEIYTARFRNSNLYCVELVDGLDIRYTRPEKWIINVSTQFGCPIRCRFCDAGGDFHGNVASSEIIEQVKFILNLHPELIETCSKLKIHLARVGEPSLNDEIIDATKELRQLTKNPNLWCCLPTVFPTQRREWFKRLKEAKDKHFLGRFQLQFSLNSTDQEQRKTMIPCNLESFEYLAEFGDFFLESGDRKIVLNFALAEDSQFQAETIINTFPAANFSVKLTPLNPTSRSLATGMKTTLRSSNARLDRDIQKLETAGYEVILSIGDGREDEIGSNCGQSIRRLNKRNELLHS